MKKNIGETLLKLIKIAEYQLNIFNRAEHIKLKD